MKKIFSVHPSGMTLPEIMVVIIISGILASLALPRFSLQIKISKNQEATGILFALYEGQQEEFRENGAYTNRLNDLFVDISAAKNFQAPVVYKNHNVNGSRVVAGITDNGNEYTLYMTTTGQIICKPGNAANPICGKMGY